MRAARLIFPVVLLSAASGSAAASPPPNPPPVTYPTAGSWSGFGWNNTTICGGNAFSTCASVAVSAISDGAGNVTVTMRVTNLSGTNGTYAGTVFTQLGLWNVPYANGVNGFSTGYGPTLTATDPNGAITGWQTGTSGLSGAGAQPDLRGVDAINGINGGLTAGNTYTFTFTITNWQGTTADFNNLGFAIHGQGGPNGCSTKLVIGANGTANQPDPNDPAYQACQTVVPEPVTMSLLATGLAGMGGAGLLRRRRKQPEA